MRARSTLGPICMGCTWLVLAGCGGPAAVAEPSATAVPTPAPPLTPADLLADAEAAIAEGESERARRQLRRALSSPSLDPDAELAWRIRARLAIVLAPDDPSEAREVAGYMCADPDPDMTPAFMRPLLVELDAANVCRGICGQMLACCRAALGALTAATGTPMNEEQTCGALEQLAESGQAAEATCEQVVDSWRQALESLPNATVPEACIR